MKRTIKTKIAVVLTGLMLVAFHPVKAQQFIDKAVIEYEVKTNIKKTMGNSSWAEMLKDQLPQFKTGYFNFTFADNKSLFKFDHWDDKVKMPEFLRKNDEDNSWFSDFNTGKTIIQKNVFGSNFNVEDSLVHINWKITNENRMIAGFNCRKAVGIVMDSVYVFAFYTDEILIPGGPCSINGLPGMIMGLTIPRMYVSYIATKVSINGVPVNDIKPVTAKKYYSLKTLKSTINDRVKEWGDADDPEARKWMEQLMWSTLL